MKRLMVLLPVLVGLAGCQTMSPEELRAADSQTCRDYGFRKKNDAFAACMQRLDLNRQAQWRANQIEMQQDLWGPPFGPYFVPRRHFHRYHH